MTRILGIDPGKSGAIALMDHDGIVLAVRDMPILPLAGKEELDIVGLVHLLRELEFIGERERIGHAFIERAESRPMQSVQSTCTTCENYGVVRAVLVTLGIPVTEVRSREWKKALDVLAEKPLAMARATELLPDAAQWWSLAKHHNRAESCMIALHGLRSAQKIISHVPDADDAITRAYALYKEAFANIAGIRELGGLAVDIQGRVPIYEVRIDPVVLDDRGRLCDLERAVDDYVEQRDPASVGMIVFRFEPTIGAA